MLFEIHLDSELPESHPEKAAIEAAVLEVLSGIPGPWSVRIRLLRPEASALVLVCHPSHSGHLILVSLAKSCVERVRALLECHYRGV